MKNLITKVTLVKREEGQAVIIVIGALVGLIALMGLVVDGGNAYVQRRQVQNAVDAATQAGTLAFAGNKTNGAVADTIDSYLTSNGVTLDPTGTKAYYVVQNTSGNNIVVSNKIIRNYTSTATVPATLVPPGYGTAMPVVGVQVQANKSFSTFFAGLVGFRQMQAAGTSAAYANKGACSAQNLFPVAISLNTFTDTTGDGVPDAVYEQDNSTYVYSLWEAKGTAVGNFGWLEWNGDSSTSTLVANINDAQNATTSSGVWSVGDNIPGTKNSRMSSVSSNVQWFIDHQAPVTIPVFDTSAGSGDNATYHVNAFARFRITAIGTGTQCGSGALSGDKCLKGKMQRWVDPQAEGGCTNFGVASVKIRPPVDTSRTLVGNVKFQKITLTPTTSTSVHVPVDVVNILDISGSMDDSFGTKTKLRAAKDALKSFNSNMRPDLGDQDSLVTFPTVVDTNGSSPYTNYNYSCTQSGSYHTYYFAEQRLGLTNNITGTNGVNTQIENLSANGGTSTAAGLQQGRQTVLGTGHRSSSIAVIILASDGLANMLLNGQWTGFQGSASNSPTCNSQAVQDAIDQANLAKSDLNNNFKPDTIIFSIAVGDNFNPSAMQAIATTDTDATKPHYFRATDANSMATIYQQISQRVQQIGTETCQVIPTEAFANGVSVVLTNQRTGTSTTVQTTSNGEFVLPNADYGTYTIQVAPFSVNGFTYNVYTDGLGGPVLGSNPTVTVGTGSGTYKTDVFLKTGDTVSCTQ